MTDPVHDAFDSRGRGISFLFAGGMGGFLLTRIASHSWERMDTDTGMDLTTIGIWEGYSREAGHGLDRASRGVYLIPRKTT